MNDEGRDNFMDYSVMCWMRLRKTKKCIPQLIVGPVMFTACQTTFSARISVATNTVTHPHNVVPNYVHIQLNLYFCPWKMWKSYHDLISSLSPFYPIHRWLFPQTGVGFQKLGYQARELSASMSSELTQVLRRSLAGSHVWLRVIGSTRISGCTLWCSQTK